jgi:release factor glutamine methyltransferase
MILGDALQSTTRVFSEHSIDDSSAEARALLKHITQVTTTSLYLHPDTQLNQQQIESLHALVKRRLQNEPSSYLTSSKEFYGISFYVDNRVLIPRPETELIVEKALEIIKSRQHIASADNPVIVADIGTGCGNIAISIALNADNVIVYATDISVSALDVAILNAKKCSVLNMVHFSQGDLTNAIIKPVDILVANLPYISSSEIPNLPLEVSLYEPKIALDGGISGLAHIKRLLLQLKDAIRPNGKAILEFGYGQKEVLSNCIKAYLPESTFKYFIDLNSIARMVVIDF